jgi:inorganic triphosphatase YgiF
MHNEVSIELTIDRGEIRAGDVVEPLSKVELKAKIGSLEALLDLARALDRMVTLALSVLYEAQCRYDFLAPYNDKSIKSRTISLTDGMTLFEGFPT